MSLPKVILVTETWLSANSPAVNVNVSNYCLVSSPRVTGRGGGVAVYVHNSVNFVVKDKSYDHGALKGIDYLLIELLQLKMSLCCMYCPPSTPLRNILSILEQVKATCALNTALVVGGDFNINLLDTTAEISSDFLNELHNLSLHPVISLPTRVTDTSATLIDNFLCDFSLLPITSNVIKVDLSDHFMIALKLIFVPQQANLLSEIFL